MRVGGRALRRLLVVALVGVTLWFAAGAAAAWHLMHPRRTTYHFVGSDGEDRYGLGYEDVELVAADGVRLAAWYARPTGPPIGTLLLLHERQGHRRLERVRFALEHGWAALAPDFRGCGDSEDAPSGFGWDERLDVDAALAWLEERARVEGDDGPLVGWGRSLGAAALVYALDPRRDPPRSHELDGLILESLYRDIDTAFANRVDQRVGVELGLPRGLARLALAPVPLCAELLTGARLDDLRPVDVLPRLADRPLLLAGGAHDARCTPEELRDLGRAAPGARVVSLEAAAHDDFLGHAAWREELTQFLAGLAAR